MSLRDRIVMRLADSEDVPSAKESADMLLALVLDRAAEDPKFDIAAVAETLHAYGRIAKAEGGEESGLSALDEFLKD